MHIVDAAFEGQTRAVHELVCTFRHAIEHAVHCVLVKRYRRARHRRLGASTRQDAPAHVGRAHVAKSERRVAQVALCIRPPDLVHVPLAAHIRDLNLGAQLEAPNELEQVACDFLVDLHQQRRLRRVG